ncbi:MAG: hypothetical protein M1835_000477 [Candelina submexicana]|nr:MAG: hypothetical protein M1835_000477 [Candelina submexicana]
MATTSTARPRVFLDVQIGTEPAGRLVIELFVDKTPKTCENFRALCTTSSADKALTYKLSPIHRIIDEFMIQGGDITKGDGTGGASIYGGEFEDENIGWREIDKEGLVCMANRGKGTNSSQFFVTLAPCPHLNLRHTIFGHLVSGQYTLARLASLPVDKNDRPLTPVIISHCGELERRKKAPILETTTATKDTTSTSPNRGRKRRKRSDSPSRSPSRSVTPDRKHHRKHRRASPSPTPPRHRRRSDHDLDSTLRGRPRLRSSSPTPLPTIPDSKPHSPPSATKRETSPPSSVLEQRRKHHHHHKRRRSPSPSRSRSRNRRRSRSPHLRRRHSRSRSWQRGWRGDRREEFRDRAGFRGREEEEAIRREEMEREGGEGRFEGLIEDDSGDYMRGGRERVWRDREAGGEGRLGGGGGGEGEVKFKGRGSMKFRERRY